jgi:hypothetical protein
VSGLETREITFNNLETRYEAVRVASANSTSIRVCLRNMASKILMLLSYILFNVPLFVCSMSLDDEGEPQRSLNRQRLDCHLQYTINNVCMEP